MDDERCQQCRQHRTRICAAAALALISCPAAGQTSNSSDGVLLTVNGDTLSGTNGGAGVAAAWLHNFDDQTLAEIGAEHQGISNAEWTLCRLDGSLSRGDPDARYTFYGDAREGAGRIGASAFDYSVVDGGVITTWSQRWFVQFEDRQIDVASTNGNLPKVGLMFLWDHRWLMSAAYAYSVGGNLGTRLTTASLQESGARFNALLGLAFGQAAPPVVDLQAALVLPGRMLREGYAGLSLPLPSWHAELSVVADYVDLAGTRRATLTLSYLQRLGHATAAANKPPG
jgi:hypothetical protein